MTVNTKKYKAYLDLVKRLNDYSEAYYLKDGSPISDAEYDALYRQLEYMEKTNPNMIAPNSPTQRVGETPQGVFKIIKHPVRMYSLSKVRTEKELRKFYKRFADMRHDLGKSNVDQYYLDYKMDGLSCDLIYVDGRLTMGLTRGDGIEGEDVTENVFRIRNIPPMLPTKRTLYVRGEVVVHKAVFDNINQEREDHGLKPFSNPRNYASGSLRQINPEITAKRGIMFYAWELLVPSKPLTSERQIDYLTKLGFSLPQGQMCTSIEDMLSFIADTLRKRKDLPYDIDGVVIKQNSPDIRKTLGFNQHDPLWATAWKFAADGQETHVKRIDWTVGRTGKIVPLAILEPVNINGVNIDTVTLFNAAKIESTKIGPGAKVKVIRAGDVIPKIDKILRLGNYDGVPTVCPICGSPVTRISNDIYCTNKSCKGILISTINYVVSKDVLDIKGLGGSFVKEAVESGTITSIKDLFIPIDNKSSNIKQTDLDRLVARVRNINLMELLMMLGVNGMGKSVAGKIASMESIAGSIHKLITTLNDPNELRFLTITQNVKENLTKWYKDSTHKDLLDYIASLNLERLK